MDGHTDIDTGFIMSTQSSRPKRKQFLLDVHRDAIVTALLPNAKQRIFCCQLSNNEKAKINDQKNHQCDADLQSNRNKTYLNLVRT